jgi:Uma2 family endonuclease
MNLVLDDTIRISGEFDNLDDFRDWTKSGAYPERGDYFYLSGDLWVDLSMETLLHNQIKQLFAVILGGILLKRPAGIYCGDRMRLVNIDADISVEPDGMFVSHKARKAGRVEWEQGADSLEVIGSPDMVLEVVSSHSIRKDTVVLRDLYSRAAIPEYWLVNPLSGQLAFDILRNTEDGYVPVRKVAGWAKSAVFGKSFRLTPASIGKDLPKCRLLVK